MLGIIFGYGMAIFVGYKIYEHIREDEPEDNEYANTIADNYIDYSDTELVCWNIANQKV